MPAAIPAALAAIGQIGAAVAAGNLAGVGLGLAALGDTVLVGTVTIGSAISLAGTAASVVSVGASLLAKPPKISSAGSPLSFSADPQAGIPYVIGRIGTTNG